MRDHAVLIMIIRSPEISCSIPNELPFPTSSIYWSGQLIFWNFSCLKIPINIFIALKNLNYTAQKSSSGIKSLFLNLATWCNSSLLSWSLTQTSARKNKRTTFKVHSLCRTKVIKNFIKLYQHFVDFKLDLDVGKCFQDIFIGWKSMFQKLIAFMA